MSSKDKEAIIIKDKKGICPICGEEVFISPEIMMSHPPVYIYYCSKCDFQVEDRTKTPLQIRIDPKILEEFNKGFMNAIFNGEESYKVDKKGVKFIET